MWAHGYNSGKCAAHVVCPMCAPMATASWPWRAIAGWLQGHTQQAGTHRALLQPGAPQAPRHRPRGHANSLHLNELLFQGHKSTQFARRRNGRFADACMAHLSGSCSGEMSEMAATVQPPGVTPPTRPRGGHRNVHWRALNTQEELLRVSMCSTRALALGEASAVNDWGAQGKGQSCRPGARLAQTRAHSS